ncbi:putative F420-0 ABC transporter permease subunit [Microcella humidisoli]|uniref:Iron chelate uptake ABC transporter family permease subunit n=1 Tax=Microcella humidisoli TaxID=2963406 RepID=A0ABY5G171_9MICO|nr:putative F420-0 ABC transporter permease subunit [Microcella humidisoli]UTT63726.1 iron chelate uptake ABC transporter family permease subunit [Microcella humidisoli]
MLALGTQPPGVAGTTGASGSRRRRITVVALLGGVVLLGALILGIVVGAADIGPAELARILLDRLTGAEPESALRSSIVWELRLPRVLTAAAVGAGLGLAGTIMQAVTRNPLADPYLLGLSSGASLGAVAVIVLGVSLLLPVAAFLGALVALAATLAIARRGGAITPVRTVLAGVAVSAMLGALTSGVIFWSATGDSYREILGWLLGTLGAADWSSAAIAGVALLVVGGALLTTSRTLDAFAFGERSAMTLGIDVPRIRLILLVATALLTGAMVSVSGAIGFVGLVMPHMVRLVVGPGHRALLPLVVVWSAAFLVLADTLARTVLDPRELPVGVVTALVGAPVFAALLARRTTIGARS